jgi:putative membrane protein
MDSYIPYCGIPPDPTELWQRWNFDPFLIGALLVILALYLFVARDMASRDRAAFLAGWALTAIVFISPLCALSMALFSARVGQHILLTLIAAPFLAVGLGRFVRINPLSAAGLFAALFWFWHAPMPYDATLNSDVIYWAMHPTLLVSAVILWQTLFRHLHQYPGLAVLGILVTGVQMSLFSAILLFSATAWHDWHEVHALSWGLTGLADQQLAAMMMWVSGGLLMAVAVAAMAREFVWNEKSR